MIYYYDLLKGFYPKINQRERIIIVDLCNYCQITEFCGKKFENYYHGGSEQKGKPKDGNNLNRSLCTVPIRQRQKLLF